ncbi:MAG: glycosyltransferase family 9 protein, partial [bacterium]
VLAPPAARGVYQDDPCCDGLLFYDPRAPFNPVAYARLVFGLRALRTDLAVCLHASFRSAMLGRLSGAPWRCVRNHSGADWFCTLRSSEIKEPKSTVQRDFDCLRALGLTPKDTRPRLAIPAIARAEARRLAVAWGLGTGSVLLFPGAGKPEKRWPLERFLSLARRLTRSGRRVLLLTAPGEESLDAQAASVGARWGSIADLKVLGALSRLTGEAIGNDSGPRHIAAAGGARTLTIFGPESLREWHPYAKDAGHWALQADTGRVLDLSLDRVWGETRAWLKAGAREREEA